MSQRISSGMRLGTEFVVGNATAADRGRPSVEFAGPVDFTVVWEDRGNVRGVAADEFHSQPFEIDLGIDIFSDGFDDVERVLGRREARTGTRQGSHFDSEMDERRQPTIRVRERGPELGAAERSLAATASSLEPYGLEP